MAPSTTIMKDISAKDPFFLLPSKVREKIITSLDFYLCYDMLCEASVVMNHERHTNKLTVCSDYILGKFDHWNYSWHVQAAHLCCRLSDGHLSGQDVDDYFNGDYYKVKLADPLLSTKPEIVYEVDALYGRLGDYLSLGPEIVRAFIERHVDRDVAHFIAKAYGWYGERYPKTYPLTAREHDHVTSFLILVDLMDVLELSGPPNPNVCYSHQRHSSRGNQSALDFALFLAVQIQQKAMQDEQLRRWNEEDPQKWQQSTKADIAGGMLGHGSDEATQERSEEEWVFV